jgi:toxin ParE1/3/4
MSLFRLTKRAQRDLDEIFAYIAEKSDETRAKNLIQVIASKFPTLGAVPGAGRSRDKLSQGLRSIPVDKYLIFYRKYLGGVRIIRVLHGARLLGPIFKNRRRK